MCICICICICLRPESRPSVFAFFLRCDMLGGLWVGGCNNVLCLRYKSSFFSEHTSCYVTRFCLHFGEHISCYVAHFCCTSVNTLHVMLHTSVVLRWSNFTSHCTLLLYLGEHTSCYVAHFCCASMNTTSLLRCKLLLYSGEHASCYVVHTSVLRWNTLHTTLYTYKLVNHPEGQFTKTVRRVQRGSPKVLAHTGTIDGCWKACKKMLPGS